VAHSKVVGFHLHHHSPLPRRSANPRTSAGFEFLNFDGFRRRGGEQELEIMRMLF
jgi:hypothetical protein